MWGIRSLRAMRLVIEICELLSEEMSKPDLVVTDAMIATVINLACVEVTFNPWHTDT